MRDRWLGGGSRWTFVLAAAGVMGMAGTYQFAWSSIRGPLGTSVGASEAALGTVFTLYIVGQTIAQFPAGWVRDRYGPRLPLAVGTVLIAGGYVGTAFATSIWEVYLFYTLGGMGAAVAYTVAVNTPVKWFTERRGLATGFVAMSYSGTSFLVIPLIRSGTEIGGTLLWLGGLAGLAALIAAVILRDPPNTEATETPAASSGPVYTWRETIRTWQFWLLYFVFIVLNGVGLMVIGKVVAFAGALNLSATTATASASVIALGDSIGLLIISAASDRLGRERTTGAMLVISGASLGGAVLAGVSGLEVLFVALIAGVVFFRSPAFAIFPTIVGEYYGTEHSSENYAVLYTAKLWGGVIGGTIASGLVVSIGWQPTFLVGAAILIAAGLSAFFLRPPTGADPLRSGRG